MREKIESKPNENIKIQCLGDKPNINIVSPRGYVTGQVPIQSVQNFSNRVKTLRSNLSSKSRYLVTDGLRSQGKLQRQSASNLKPRTADGNKASRDLLQSFRHDRIQP